MMTEFAVALGSDSKLGHTPCYVSFHRLRPSRPHLPFGSPQIVLDRKRVISSLAPLSPCSFAIGVTSDPDRGAYILSLHDDGEEISLRETDFLRSDSYSLNSLCRLTPGLLAGASNRGVEVWDYSSHPRQDSHHPDSRQSREPVFFFRTISSRFCSLDFNPSTPSALIVGSNSCEAWDYVRSTLLSTLLRGRFLNCSFSGLAHSEDRQIQFISTSVGHLLAFDCRTWQNVTGYFSMYHRSVNSTFSLNYVSSSSLLLVPQTGGIISVFDLRKTLDFQLSNSLCHILSGHSRRILDSCVIPDHNCFLTAGERDKTIKCWTLDSDSFGKRIWGCNLKNHVKRENRGTAALVNVIGLCSDDCEFGVGQVEFGLIEDDLRERVEFLLSWLGSRRGEDGKEGGVIRCWGDGFGIRMVLWMSSGC